MPAVSMPMQASLRPCSKKKTLYSVINSTMPASSMESGLAKPRSIDTKMEVCEYPVEPLFVEWMMNSRAAYCGEGGGMTLFLLLSDMMELESQLQESSDSRIKLIVSDGVFSMDGKITPLR